MSLRIAVFVMLAATVAAGAAGTQSNCAADSVRVATVGELPRTELSALYEFARDFKNTRFDGLDLRAQNFHRADLRGASLKNADLSGVDLRMALLDGADLRGTDLRGARFARSQVIAADRASWAGAIIDGSTALPFRCSEARRLGIEIKLSKDSDSRSDGVTHCSPSSPTLSLNAD